MTEPEQVHTLIIGSGAAGLNAALQLHRNNITDILILTEGLQMGTSINTGSDKQTYYKLGLGGSDSDSPATMAETYYEGGGMHGDLALVEAALSPRAFVNLVNIGVPFPRDEYGQFIGYKTDHDPRQRATSIGPYTSREMCRALIREVKDRQIPLKENTNVVQLLTIPDDQTESSRACGAIAVNEKGEFVTYLAENVIFATGGPGGIYKTSVYPEVHTGGIGLALMAGAKAQGLPESQYGMASIKFRWNVSGTYMQVIPKFISVAPDGKSDEKEFMRDYFNSAGQMNSNIFLKGYQWPFDSRKAIGGSSIVDILVYIETVLKGRRVFMDFRSNPGEFKFDELGSEAFEYLEKSNALTGTPIERLRIMNPGAIELYKDNGIDITSEPLEIAVCAQHNNGGLAANHWWESINIKRLFPIGEVNGSHGIYRPGGSALNSGQVAGIRAAEFIANACANRSLDKNKAKTEAAEQLSDLKEWVLKAKDATTTWEKEREELQSRMSKAGAHIRSRTQLEVAVGEAWEQWEKITKNGCAFSNHSGQCEALRNRQLCFAHAVYLESIQFALESGTGSRGSAIVLDPDGQQVHDKLDDTWKMVPENTAFRDKVMETRASFKGEVINEWIVRRGIPEVDSWFETAWARFRNGEIYHG